MTLNKPSGNMYPWCYTWNPVGGRCRHKCKYCYIGKIALSFGLNKYIGEPRLYENAFKDRLVVPEEYIIFVQSMGDLFAYGIPGAWIQRILNHIRRYRNTTFLLQTKNPERFFDFNIPKNCILGTTLETNRDLSHLSKAPSPKERYYSFAMLANEQDFKGNKVYRLMVSAEPVIDLDLDTYVQWIQAIAPEFVSIGADSGKNNLAEPSAAKLKELIRRLEKFTEVRQKKNLSRLMKEP